MGGPTIPTIPTLSPGDDVQAFVDARIAEGADYIKIIYEHALPTIPTLSLSAANAETAVGALHHAGVPILAGTDAPAPGTAHGLSLHRELELLVLSGLTLLEALASATSEPARAFGFYDRGRIAEGRRADLLLVNGDPSIDITATRDIVGA